MGNIVYALWEVPVGVCGGIVWQRRGVEMGVLDLMRVMIISYFMTVICVGREGVVAIVIF